MAVDILVRHARQLLTLTGPAPNFDNPVDPTPLGIIEDGAVACANGIVVGLGKTSDIEREFPPDGHTTVIDAQTFIVAPGLLDVHTHALFAGDRAGEFALRLGGATYAEISKAGGGIASTARAMKELSETELAADLNVRLSKMSQFGVTTVEVKTGYGLDTDGEVRSLRAIHEARQNAATRVFSTFLPLHAIDPSLGTGPESRRRFLERALTETFPAGLAEGPDFIDAYLDSTGFSVEEAKPLLTKARQCGVPIRLHVGQFEDVQGAEFAADLGACSADHLENVSDIGLQKMARAGVVGVLLPGAAFSLGQSMPDARRMRHFGVEIAVATDCNPGTSFTENLPLMVAFAVRQSGLTIVEGWWSITRAAAKSLRRPELGSLAVGGPADLCLLDLSSWEALPYHFGSPLAYMTVVAGRVCFQRF